MSAVLIATSVAVGASVASSRGPVAPPSDNELAVIFLFAFWLITWMVCWIFRDDYDRCSWSNQKRRWQWYPMVAIHYMSLGLGIGLTLLGFVASVYQLSS